MLISDFDTLTTVSKPVVPTRFAILTPLPVEYDAMRAHILDQSEPLGQILPTTTGTLGGQSVVCVLSGKGEANAAASFQHVSQVWNPRWLFLVGIAGGLLGLKRGDVIVANYVYYLDFGKLTQGKYIRRPEYDFSPDRSLLAHAELIAERIDPAWQDQIKVKRPDSKPNQDSRASIGYVGSGNKVIDDPGHAFFRAVRLTIPELHAVEMEAAGAGAGLRLEQSRRAVGILMIRGISDIPVVSMKGKTGSAQRRLWKGYAAAAAAAFLETVISIMPTEAEITTAGPQTHEDSKVAARTSFNDTGNPRIGSADGSTAKVESTSNEGDQTDYARVLLPLEAERLFYAGDPANRKLFFDDTGLSRVTEEMLSLGCLQVALPQGAPFAHAVQHLPPALKNRVICVDELGEEAKRVTSLFEPIAAELNIPVHDFRPRSPLLPPMGASLVNEKDERKKLKIASLSQLFEGTYSLFLALRYKLQVDLDVEALIKHVETLRGDLRDPGGRANLASLTGLLRTYRGWSIETFSIALSRKKGQPDLFNHFWGNQAFRRLSHQQYLIGIPSETAQAVRAIGGLASELVRNTHDVLSPLVRSRTLQASVGIENPSNELEHDAYVGGFFPPIVPLRGLVWRAITKWTKDLPESRVALMLAVEGIREYLPNPPPMVVIEAAPLRYAFRSGKPIQNLSEFDLFQTMLSEGLRVCAEHGTAPEVSFRRTTAGEFEIRYRVCCGAQESETLESWDKKPID